MQDAIAQEVQDALTATPEEIAFEHLQNEDSSPLNQPVIEKDIGGESPITKDQEAEKSWNVWKPGQAPKMYNALEVEHSGKTQTDFRSAVEANVAQEKAQEPLDAPEQDIQEEASQSDTDQEYLSDQNFEVPLAQANQAAEALLGMANNVIAVGGGYFVKLKKHKAFYEFEEVLQVIDTQNEKNLERVKLDKDDQVLLRPLLAQVLRKKAKKLTPEQQLMGAIVSILMKKSQIVLEVRAENAVLEERILDIIREERGFDMNDTEADIQEDESSTEDDTQASEDNNQSSEIEDVEAKDTDANTPVLEVADDSKTTS